MRSIPVQSLHRHRHHSDALRREGRAEPSCCIVNNGKWGGLCVTGVPSGWRGNAFGRLLEQPFSVFRTAGGIFTRRPQSWQATVQREVCDYCLGGLRVHRRKLSSQALLPRTSFPAAEPNSQLAAGSSLSVETRFQCQIAIIIYNFIAKVRPGVALTGKLVTRPGHR